MLYPLPGFQVDTLHNHLFIQYITVSYLVFKKVCWDTSDTYFQISSTEIRYYFELIFSGLRSGDTVEFQGQEDLQAQLEVWIPEQLDR